MVKTDGRYWTRHIALDRDTDRITLNVESRGSFSIGLGQTEKCKKTAQNRNGCFEVNVNDESICLNPNTDISEEEAQRWCVRTKSGHSDHTISLEWKLEQHSAETHHLTVQLFDHASGSHLSGQWALEANKFPQRSTDFETVNFNAKGHETTFYVWFNQG